MLWVMVIDVKIVIHFDFRLGCHVHVPMAHVTVVCIDCLYYRRMRVRYAVTRITPKSKENVSTDIRPFTTFPQSQCRQQKQLHEQ